MRTNRLVDITWHKMKYCVLFLLLSANCYATETDVSFNNYPASPDLASDRALPDLFTGAMSYTIPIRVPPGRNGMTPNVELTYKSNNGNGSIGMAWEIEMGSIHRSTRSGINYSKDDYQWRKPGGTMDLAHLSDSPGNLYRAKLDREFNRIRKLTASDGNPYWEVTNKVGTRFLFGQTWDSRQSVDSTNDIYKWCLDLVIDTNGNYMTLRYTKNQGQIYLSEIEYAGNGSMSPTSRVKFYYEDGRSDAPVMYTTNSAVCTAYRLRTIDVTANNGRVRAYKLQYDYSMLDGTSLTGRSLLVSVSEYGRDAQLDLSGNVLSGTSFPPVTLNYAKSQHSGQTTQVVGGGWNGWLVVNTWNGPALTVPNQVNSQCTGGDYDGDGKTDIACNDRGTWEMGLSALSTVQSGWPNRTWTGPTIASTVYGVPVANQCLAGDFEGDGRKDIVCYPGTGETWNMALSGWITDNGWYSILSWLGPLLHSGSPTVSAGYDCLTGDFDGDKNTDISCYEDNGTWLMALSSERSGIGWQARNWLGPTLATSLSSLVPDKCVTGDFNGDGKTDMACFDSGAWKLAVSTGKSWQTSTWSGPTVNQNASIGDQCIVGDFNGDGSTDMACYTGTYPNNWRVALSDGASWRHADWVGPILLGSHVGSQCLTGDYNGDGKTDFACLDNYGANSGDTWNVALSYGNGWQTRQWTGLAPRANVPIGHQCVVGDFDGNGKSDVACYTGSGSTWNMALSYADRYWATDLLTTVSNGFGYRTDIEYWPSTADSPTPPLPWLDHHNPLLPFPVHTIHSITTCDNFSPTSQSCGGNSSTTNYSFAGGYYQIYKHDFRGFNYAKVTGPTGPGGEEKIVETWFHQGDSLAVDANNPGVIDAVSKGLPYRIRTSGAVNGQSPTIFSEVETTYEYVSDPDHIAPHRIDTYSCAGGVSGACKGSAGARHSQSVYTYDQYGNVTREDQHGDVDNSNDDRTVVRSFSPNTDSYIVGLAATEDVYAGIGTSSRVAGKSYYYDDYPDCTASPTNNQTPTTGNLTRVVSWLDGGANPENRMAYGPYGNPVCSRDARGATSTFSYDSTYTFQRMKTNPLGHQTTIEYYGVDGKPVDTGHYGQIYSITDPNGSVVTNIYDALGRQIRATKDANGSWTGWSYNNLGTVGLQNVRVDTSAGLWSESYFDGMGRTVKERRSGPESKIIATETEYDKRGAVTQVSVPYFEGIDSPRYKTFTVDTMGRITNETSPDPNTRVLSCHDEGIRVIIDPNNHRKRETRDVYGRLVKVEEYTGTFPSCTTESGSPYATTTYGYDVFGNLINVTDAKQNVTTIHYDTLGRKQDMTDPDMGFWQYQYDANGNLRLQTDALGQSIKFNYDYLNRLITKDYGADDWAEITYKYDEPSTTYTSYPVGRLTRMIDLSGSTQYFYDRLGRTTHTVKTVDADSYTIGASYDDLDRVSTLTYPRDNETVIYEYDTGGNIHKAGSYATYGGYNALGQPGSITFGNSNVTTNYSYSSVNRNNWLSSIVTTSPGQGTLISLAYDYYDNGNIKSITDGINSSIPHLMTSRSYSPHPGKVHAFGITGTDFAYDSNGNMTNDGQRTMTYNQENMPDTLSYNGQLISFVYDGSGTRVKKIAPGATTTYIDKLFECVGSTCAKYIFAGNTRIALKDSSGTYYYHQDHLGSTVAVTGSMVENITYYPFGEIRSDTGSAGLNHKYTSQELDHETGLYNYNARLYYPEIGRFITADTIVPDYTNPQSLNRYAYVLNNPMNHVDPTGREWRPTTDGLSYSGYEWVPSYLAYDEKESLLPGLYQQAIYFTENGSFDTQSQFNIGSSTAYVYKADGTIVTFDATTYPSDISNYPIVPEGIYEARVGMHQDKYIGLRMDDIGPSDRIELGKANPAYIDGRNYAEGINIHMAGKDNFTGIGQNGKAVSEGCLTIDRNKWSGFINIFNNKEQRNNIFSVTVSRTYQVPTNQNSPLLRLFNPGGWILP